MQNVAQDFVAGVIRTLDEEVLIVPNSTLVQNTVPRFTLRESVHRPRATAGVACSSDVRTVMAAPREATR